MEATEATAEELYDQTFIEQPAILDKYKAAALIVDGKYKYINNEFNFSKSGNAIRSINF